MRTHLFLCMLVCHVKWHMREAWRELLFSDPYLEDALSEPDPVLSRVRSEAARRKDATGQLDDGSTVYSFRTLIEHLETITRNVCRNKHLEDVPFELDTLSNDKQQRALDLLKMIRF